MQFPGAREILELGGKHELRLCLRVFAESKNLDLSFDYCTRVQKPGSGPLQYGKRPYYKARALQGQHEKRS